MQALQARLKTTEESVKRQVEDELVPLKSELVTAKSQLHTMEGTQSATKTSLALAKMELEETKTNVSSLAEARRYSVHDCRPCSRLCPMLTSLSPCTSPRPLPPSRPGQ